MKWIFLLNVTSSWRSLVRELSGVLEDVLGIKKLRDLSALSEDPSANG
jgi:hypothetical protein